jgi:hypothetical protein
MGNPKKKYNDFKNLRQQFDGSDPIFGAFKTGGNGWAGHNDRVANPPEWAMDDAAVRAILLRAFPRWNKNQTQYERALRWVYIIQHYFRMGEPASLIALELRHMDKSEEVALEVQTGKAPKQEKGEIERLIKRVTDTVDRISRVAKGLRANGKPRIGKLGRPKKVERVS